MGDDRWIEVTPSPFDHERDGLEYLRARIPDEPPYRVWTNFEFRDGHGHWHEVDALLLGRTALHLIELKHYYGTITGNDRLWTRNGRTEDSPLLLARRKAQKLASKLKDVYRELAGPNPEVEVRKIVPFVQEAVFLHHEKTRILLPPGSRQNLYGLDELASDAAGLDGISELIQQVPGRHPGIHPQQEEFLTLLLERIGLVQRRERAVGSWVLVDGGAIAEGEDWQDWEASHRETGDAARIRFRSGADGVIDPALRRIVDHEYRVMRTLHHDGLIRPIDLVSEDSLGRGLVYDWDTSLQRLDHWLATHDEQLDLPRRLEVIRAVGDVLAYAHGNGLVHRGLTPQTIWIGEPDHAGAALTVKVSDWQSVGSTRDEPTETGVTRHISAADVDDLDIQHRGYAAPEGRWSAAGIDRATLDQYSLGAVAYFVLSGKDPAATPAELDVRLREQSGLDLAVDIPELPSSLRTAVRTATQARPTARYPSIRDFLEALDETEQVPEDVLLDPREASKNDLLGEGRFRVLSRLGKGSTAIGLLVEDTTLTTQNKQRVLKVALDEKAGRRLADEAEVLSRVSNRKVAALIEGPIDLGPTTALLLESAGESTLQDELRRLRRGLAVDQLERYGGDLLEAMEALEKAGIDHRDIKPANLGIGLSSGKRWQMRLFDFSLSRAAASDIEAGTPPYLDPFLGEQGRSLYDSAAERYAAAVVLFEMATGERPWYGDDPQAHPATVTDDITLEEGLFPEGIQQELSAYFRRALARSADERFATVGEMRSSWREVFGETTTASSDAGEIAAAATPETPLAQAGLSPRAISWLTGEGLQTVRDLVVLDPLLLGRTRGLTQDTRKEVQDRAREWRRRFGDIAPMPSSAGGELPSIEEIASQLLTTAEQAEQPVLLELVEMILGRGRTSVSAFSNQAVLGAAATRTLSTSAVNQHLITAQEHWSRDDAASEFLRAVIAVVDEQLDDVHGGVATPEELAASLIDNSVGGARKKRSEAPAQRRTALGLVRLAVDARRHRRRGGDQDAPALDVRRRGEKVLAIGRSTELLDLALALAETVDDAVAELQGTLGADRSRGIVELLLEGVDSTILRAGHRALRLGASISQHAAVSSAGELHRKDLDQVAAIRIALGATSPDESITPEALADRVASRFPALPPLPSHPQLDELVASAGLELRYDPEQQRYVNPTLHGDTTGLTRRAPTVIADDRTEVEDSTVTRRLEESRRRRSYLVLGIAPSRLKRLEDAVDIRFSARILNLSTLLMEQMREVLASNPKFPSWETILEADAGAEGSRAQQAVKKVVDLAMPAVRERIQQALAADYSRADDRRPLVLTDVDPLVRYGQEGELRRLSDLSVARDRAVWVILPQYSIHTGPVVDGVHLTTSPSQFLDIDYAWADAQVSVPAAELYNQWEDAL